MSSLCGLSSGDAVMLASATTVNLDPAAIIAAVVALFTAMDAHRRSGGNRRELRRLRAQVGTLRGHLMIVLGALQAAEEELAARNPMIRSEDTRRHAPPH